MKDVVVIGGGGHAKVVISILKKLDCYNISGYTDHEDYGRLLGIPYLGKDDYLTDNKKDVLLALGVGQIKNVEIRKNIVQKFKKLGYKFETVVSPTAIINENVNIGEGTVVMDGVVINTYTNIGEFSIINTRSSIDHDCEIGNFVHIAPGVILCGSVEIDDNTFIGTGTTIIQNIKIGLNCLINAGTIVKKSIDNNSKIN